MKDDIFFNIFLPIDDTSASPGRLAEVYGINRLADVHSIDRRTSDSSQAWRVRLRSGPLWKPSGEAGARQELLVYGGD